MDKIIKELNSSDTVCDRRCWRMFLYFAGVIQLLEIAEWAVHNNSIAFRELEDE